MREYSKKCLAGKGVEKLSQERDNVLKLISLASSLADPCSKSICGWHEMGE